MLSVIKVSNELTTTGKKRFKLKIMNRNEKIVRDKVKKTTIQY